MYRSVYKRALALCLAAALAVGLMCTCTSAKTTQSAKGENIFFYVRNADGQDVLLKIVPLDELDKNLSHGQLSNITSGSDTGTNYYYSMMDNYPTPQYGEAQGFTIPELVDYMKKVSGESSLSYTGGDTILFMATDSYGTYNRSWSYDELYGVKRYYFEGLFDETNGWKTGWEVAGEDSSKFGITLDEYNAQYKDSDPYYSDKRAVFEGGVETTVTLATQSFSGRTTSSSLVASTEPGVRQQIQDNGGVAAGSLEDLLTDECALRLNVAMTEGDLMAAHRTAYDNFKWIYNIRLDMENAPALKPQGTVAAPEAAVTLSGNTVNIDITCETEGAQIYYSYDGSPQIPYTGTLSVDVTDRDLAADPVTFYMTAVREGWADAGIIMNKYPGLSPNFETLYNGLLGEDLVFTGKTTVSDAEWTDWTKNISFITIKTPSSNGYVTLDASKYSIDDTARTITFDKSLFEKAGAFAFIVHASTYADRTLTISMKDAAPQVHVQESYSFDSDITVTFDSTTYQSGMNVYFTPPGGSATMISTSYLDRDVAGQVTIKKEYFERSNFTQEPGAYILTLSNTQFQPSSQDVTVTFTSGGFTDVKAGAWYEAAVSYAVSAGLFNGTSATEFSPDTGMTRGMFVTVLGRMAGAQTSGYSQTGYSDAPIDQWYGGYIAWASENSIVTGVGDGKFDPDGLLTREQIAAMLYRYEQFIGGDTTTRADLSAFPDSEAVSDWARDALAWANGQGLMNGMDGALAPKGTASRAQVAQIFMNYAQ
ncbi:MAG: S-layer homology domain-containing protein [Oscillospiraceae bacterium]|nr:S-layer homology domain-containing protein [Oscillospiraceae bacterium]